MAEAAKILRPDRSWWDRVNRSAGLGCLVILNRWAGCSGLRRGGLAEAAEILRPGEKQLGRTYPLCATAKAEKKPAVEGNSPPGGFAVFYKNFYRNFGNQKNRLSSPAKPQPCRASSLHISCTVSWIAS